MPRGALSPEARLAASQHMKRLWRTPAFVDGQMRRTVRRWDNADYRHRQNLAVRAGRRPAPMANAYGDTPCTAVGIVEGHGGVRCRRRDDHAYHVGRVGSAEALDLRLVGWED